ncbi:TetR/AcrR family transcriptional regulator [Celeribacter litoreus]|uniref:TetR/AcrR family transcriptional regulator n=1 Tax=Celeribacter litoreus TaxID=2876714 RepID=UPI001CD02F11|nr:TetR/AcrR family transcriptional regulator [Celeribacter litoreus]MCA0044581.1 TetR/AcrR family transcriptional regulator [Celeribacter litoreus]
MGRPPSYDRETALDQALETFWAKGYHATSLKDLEAALKMNPGSIYAAFGSKDALFEAALDRYAARSKKLWAENGGGYDSPLSSLANFLRDLGGGSPTVQGPGRACMLIKTLLELSGREGELGQKARGFLDANEADFKAVFDRARDLGEIAPDADTDLLAMRMLSFVFGLRVQLEKEGLTDRVAAHAEDLAQQIEALRV